MRAFILIIEFTLKCPKFQMYIAKRYLLCIFIPYFHILYIYFTLQKYKVIFYKKTIILIFSKYLLELRFYEQ